MTSLRSIAIAASLTAVACQSTIAVSQSSGTASGVGGSGGGASTTTTTGGAGGVGGAGGAPAAGCHPGSPPYAGPLCGPPGAPCTVHADDVLPNPAAFRNDAPAIAVDPSCVPRVLFSSAENGYFGFDATRTGGGWKVAPTPFNAATVGLVMPPGSAPLAMADDGAYGVTLWKLAGATWAQVDQLPGMRDFWSKGIGYDDKGTLHATFMDSNGGVGHGKHVTSWSIDMPGDQSSGAIPLAVSTTGAAHYAYWTSSETTNGWELMWAVAPSIKEPVFPLLSNTLNDDRVALAVTPPAAGNPDGVPHIFYGRQVSSTQAVELRYATRQGPGSWKTHLIDQSSMVTCPPQPSHDGEMCAEVSIDVHAIAIVASRGGDVRFLYERVQSTVMEVGQCVSGSCVWTQQGDDTKNQLFIAWVDGSGQVGTAPVADDIMALSGNAVVDAAGHVHVAVYDSVMASPDSSLVRVLDLGP